MQKKFVVVVVGHHLITSAWDPRLQKGQIGIQRKPLLFSRPKNSYPARAPFEQVWFKIEGKNYLRAAGQAVSKFSEAKNLLEETASV